jgi:hypothetical protein
MQADAADIVEAAVAADRVQASWLARQGADVVELWVGRCPAEASDDAVKCAIVQHLLDEQANAYGMRDIYDLQDFKQEHIIQVTKPPYRGAQRNKQGRVIPHGSSRYVAVRGCKVAEYLCTETEGRILMQGRTSFRLVIKESHRNNSPDRREAVQVPLKIGAVSIIDMWSCHGEQKDRAARLDGNILWESEVEEVCCQSDVIAVTQGRTHTASGANFGHGIRCWPAPWLCCHQPATRAGTCAT